MANFNMDDPSKQEQVRRGSHEYIPGEGKHGVYVPRDYLHREYPKVMDRTPAPQRKQFKSDQELELARQEWDAACRASIVNSKAEEEAWLAANGQEKQKKSKAA